MWTGANSSGYCAVAVISLQMHQGIQRMLKAAAAQPAATLNKEQSDKQVRDAVATTMYLLVAVWVRSTCYGFCSTKTRWKRCLLKNTTPNALSCW